MYDKTLSEEQIQYNAISHMPYDKIPTFDSLGSLIDCPADIPKASIAVKITDNTMEPKLKQGSYVFIEFGTPLDNRDIGLFSYDGKLLIRKFIVRKDGVVLRADNKDIEDIVLEPHSSYHIVGKVVGTISN